MALLQLNLNPSRKELRWFAGLWFPAFWGMMGFLTFRRHHSTVAMTIWICAAALALAGLAAPAVIRPLYVVMMRLTFPIGWVTSHLVLVLAWFGVITPIGWLIRRFHDPMQRKLSPSAESYWEPWEPADRGSYFRQL